MIKITILAPYKAFKNEIIEVLESYPKNDTIEFEVIELTANQLIDRKINSEIIVARGFTAEFLDTVIDMPHVIEIKITSYDIVKALSDCSRKYRPDKVALIVKSENEHIIQDLGLIFGFKIDVFTPRDVGEIEEILLEARKSDYGAVIGGYSVYNSAKNKGLPSILIKTGTEAITKALNEAVRAISIMRQEREKASIQNMIVKHSNYGIMYVNKQQELTLVNDEARKYMDMNNIEEILNNIRFHINVKKVFSGGQLIKNVISILNGIKFSFRYDPIFGDEGVVGVVVQFQAVEKIREDEIHLRKALSHKGLVAKYSFSEIIFKSKIMEDTIKIAGKYAQAPSNIMIEGETGTGKELLAQGIHNSSPRRTGPFVAVNCAAIPENLLDSELFGYSEGAFTGSAKGGKIGLFEMAHGGSIFLDEISELPISFQSKLLRVIQEQEIRRIGDDRIVTIDVRVIAAANKNLLSLVEENKFRQDLMYRIAVLTIRVPSLRERMEDIELLFNGFLESFSQQKGYGKIKGIEQDALDVLKQHKYPGNVRELRNIAERASIIFQDKIVEIKDMDLLLDKYIVGDKEITKSSFYRGNEQDVIEEIMEKYKGNKTLAAKELGMSRSTLWRKLNNK